MNVSRGYNPNLVYLKRKNRMNCFTKVVRARVTARGCNNFTLTFSIDDALPPEHVLTVRSSHRVPELGTMFTLCMMEHLTPVLDARLNADFADENRQCPQCCLEGGTIEILGRMFHPDCASKFHEEMGEALS